jgi:maleylpyruvate isomerase
MSLPDEQDPLAEASQLLARTVDRLESDEWRAPTILPGWSRAHVIAHVALNAEGLAGALEGIVRGEPTPMYASNEARDADIDELAGAPVADIRDRLFAGTTRFADAFAALEAEHLDASFPRTPGGDGVPVAAVMPMRLREVVIHHTDLGAGYAAADWPADFCIELLDVVTVDHGADGPFTVHATDVDRRWDVGGPGLTVSGSAGDLGWRLVGRGDGTRLSADGDLPTLGPWRRAPAR